MHCQGVRGYGVRGPNVRSKDVRPKGVRSPVADTGWDTCYLHTYEPPIHPNSAHYKVYVDPRTFLHTASYPNRNPHWNSIPRTFAWFHKRLFCQCIGRHRPIQCYSSKCVRSWDRDMPKIGPRLLDISLGICSEKIKVFYLKKDERTYAMCILKKKCSFLPSSQTKVTHDLSVLLRRKKIVVRVLQEQKCLPRK